MIHHWLLVETLGDQPLIVAQGRRMQDFVPVPQFLRRNPNLAAIQNAITETVTGGTGLASITPKTRHVIRTEPVVMTDGRIHAIHVWSGPADAEPPERPVPGPFKWDLTGGVVTDSVEALANAGLDPGTEQAHGRVFADDVPNTEFNRAEAKVLALIIDPQPDRTVCSTWDLTDVLGTVRRLGFALRTALEVVEDGSEHVVLRGTNLVAEPDESVDPFDEVTRRVLDLHFQQAPAESGETPPRPGEYRALVDLHSRHVLKWFGERCPFFEWRGGLAAHPDDRLLDEAMVDELATGATSRVIRLPGSDGQWIPVHLTISRVEIDGGIHGGLAVLRLPTDGEIAEAGLEPPAAAQD